MLTGPVAGEHVSAVENPGGGGAASTFGRASVCCCNRFDTLPHCHGTKEMIKPCPTRLTCRLFGCTRLRHTATAPKRRSNPVPLDLHAVSLVAIDCDTSGLQVLTLDARKEAAVFQKRR